MGFLGDIGSALGDVGKIASGIAGISGSGNKLSAKDQNRMVAASLPSPLAGIGGGGGGLPPTMAQQLPSNSGGGNQDFLGGLSKLLSGGSGLLKQAMPADALKSAVGIGTGGIPGIADSTQGLNSAFAASLPGFLSSMAGPAGEAGAAAGTAAAGAGAGSALSSLWPALLAIFGL